MTLGWSLIESKSWRESPYRVKNDYMGWFIEVAYYTSSANQCQEKIFTLAF